MAEMERSRPNGSPAASCASHLPADLPQACRRDVPRRLHPRRGPFYDHQAFKPWRLQALAFKAIRRLYPDYPLWRDFPYEYEFGKLAIDVINGSPLLREWVDDAGAAPGDLDALTIPDERLGRGAQTLPALLTFAASGVVNEEVGGSPYSAPELFGSGASMATQGIEEVTENAIRAVARDCGSLSMECSDVAGYVQGVAERIGEHLKMLDQLEEVTTRLLGDQARVSDSTDEARLLSEQAKAKLEAGREAIEGTIDGFKGLTDLVVQLGERMAGFASAMNQVQTSPRPSRRSPARPTCSR
jgi:hypothetical protein